MVFSPQIEQILLISVGNHKGPQIAKETLKKENGLEASPSLTSHSAEKLQSPKQCGTGSKRAQGPEEQDRETRIQPTRTGSVNLWHRDQGHTKEHDTPHDKWCWENWTPHNSRWLPCTQTWTKTQLSTPSPPSLTRRRTPSTVSRPQEASPHFSSPSLHLFLRHHLGPQET